MASYQAPGVNNPVYNVSQSVEVQIQRNDEESQEDNEQSVRERAETTGSMLEFLVVQTRRPEDCHSLSEEERDPILINDGRGANKDDAIIDLNIDSKALNFVNFFLLITLQRIPRHYSKRTKLALKIAQAFVVVGMLLAIAHDMGVFDTISLTTSQWDDLVTSVKNVICNFKFPLLYIVGIFYFRSRNLEDMLSRVKLTKRYWKYGRNVLIVMITMVYIFTVVVPIVCNAAQMSFPNDAEAHGQAYDIETIILYCCISIVLRSMSLSVVFAFILEIYLIYCRVRLFKEQIQKWPRQYMDKARNDFIDICEMIRNAERAFQPFLLVHFTIFLFLLVPLTLSCVEQFESQGRYMTTVMSGQSVPFSNPITIQPTTLIDNAANKTTPLPRRHLLSNNLTESAMDKFNKNVKPQKKPHTDIKGIIKVALIIVADILETIWLYVALVILISKVDKCIRAIRDRVHMLKFDEQQEQDYMFQSKEDISHWDSILSDARGIEVLGFNLASFKAAVITLLFPFVTTMFRFMLRHVNIIP